MKTTPRLSFTTLLAGALVLATSSATAASPPATPPRDPSAPPQGVSASDWSGIRAAHEAARHAVRTEEDGTLVAENPRQQWSTVFDGRGFTVTPESGGWTWGLELRRYGFSGAERTVGKKAGLSHERGRVHYDWDATLREWFINDVRGLEQGWTFHERPAGAADGEPLRLELTVRGGLLPRVTADGTSVSYLQGTGAAMLKFGGLKAWDANGKTLPVRFERAGNDVLRIAVDEQGARYPVSIDPVAQQATIPQPADDPDFGESLAISGDTIVIGSPRNANGPNVGNSSDGYFVTGAVYVFVRDGTGWTEEARLKARSPSRPNINDAIGAHVAIWGDTVITSGFLGVYVFVRNGTRWSQQACLQSGTTGFRFSAVAISGDTVVAGGGINDPLDEGAAYVFVRNGTTWTKQARLKAHNAEWGDAFGQSVSIWGDTLVVGARKEGRGSNEDDASIRQSGAAYVFVRSGTTWSQQGYLKASDETHRDFFGYSVSISGDTVAVAAPTDGHFTEPGGRCYIFVRNGATWTQQAKLTPPSGQHTLGNSLNGYGIAVFGDTVVVTSGVGNDTEGRAADVFVRNGTTWTLNDTLNEGPNHEGYGAAVGVSANTIVVGGAGARVFVVETPAALVQDASRTGTPVGGVEGVDVMLVVGENVIATTTTDSVGHFKFEEPAPDPTMAYDVWLEKEVIRDGTPYVVRRMYQGARIGGSNPTTLVLPVGLHERLHTELKKLEQSGSAFIRSYNTAPLRALIEEWNSIDLLSSTTHKNNDAALGRMLTAVQGMAEGFTATTPLAQDAGKVFANTILSFLAAAETANNIQEAAAGQLAGAGGTLSSAVSTAANQMLVEALKSLLDVGKSAFLDLAKAGLKDPDTVVMLDLMFTFVVEHFFEAAANGQWDQAAGVRGGLKAMLEVLAEFLGEKLGGGMIASGYVLSTDDPVLQTTVLNGTQNQTGTGTVVEGLRASQAVVGELVTATDAALSESTLLSSVSKGWGYVADVTEKGALVPGGQVLVTITTAIRTLNVGMLARALSKDMVTVYDNAKRRIPKVAEYAFTTAGAPPPESGLAAFATNGVPDGEAPPPPTTNGVPAGYVAALSALRAEIVAGNHEGTLNALPPLQAQDAALKAAMTAALGRAEAAADSDTALGGFFTTMREASTEVTISCAELYISLVGLVIPSFADPGSTQARVLAQVDAVSAGLTAFDAAVAAAETAGAAVQRPAYLLITKFGVDGVGINDRTQPGQATFTAWIVNAGDVTATGFTAQLTGNNPAAPTAVMAIQGPGTQALADLAPGESRTVTWPVLLTDISANSTGSAASYTLALSGPAGVTSSVTGGIKVITAINTPPEVTLTGSSPLIVDARPAYTDAGATAQDRQDGLLTPVLVSNNVLSGVPGDYTVTYSATDSSGLTTTVTRNVKVVPSALPVIEAPAGGFVLSPLVAGGLLPDYTAQTVASDNSGNVTIRQSPMPGSALSEGTLTITLTARDAAGNESSISFDVIVSAAADTGIVSDDFPLTPQNMSFHNDFTAHPTNGWLYGTCASGGIHDQGMIYRVNSTGGYQTLVHFTDNGAHNQGKEPAGRMALAPDGNFYGATASGGANGFGTVFKMTPEGALSTLVSLTGTSGAAMGEAPFGGPFLGPNGDFYGTTKYGGADNLGTIFRITPGGVFTTLVSFTGDGATNKGSRPTGALALGADGNFYGTTGTGGASNYGTIFRVTPAGVLTTLVEFTGDGTSNRGSKPSGSLTLGTDGDFYGLTTYGGIDYKGTVFKMTPAGVLTTLIEFTGSSDPNVGSYPQGDLIIGADGNFYGVATEGGAYGYGAVFKITPSGVPTPIMSFSGGTTSDKGAYPYGSLALGTDGCFYGTTRYGGGSLYDRGTIFKVTPAGELTTLLESGDFNNGVNEKGAYLTGELTIGPDGSFYGTASRGGTFDKGLIFKVDAAGQRTTLVNFADNGELNKGALPQSAPILAGDGFLYGTTVNGGFYDLGTIYELSPAGELFTLVEFTGDGETNKGAHPYGRLTPGPDGNFYGMTNEGGDNNLGTVFRMTKNGELSTLLHFSAAVDGPGARPTAHLTLAPDGHLYGMANSGGANDYGTIFRITTAGVTTVLFSFNTDSGGAPWGGLSVGPGGALFGMTNDGGANDFGTAFKITTSGVFTKLADFTGSSGPATGAKPFGSLQAAPDGFLYGTTGNGGAYDMGTLFRLSPAGVITTLTEFKGSGSGIESGGWPNLDEFILSNEGKLYGMTQVGGRQGGGMIYRVPTLDAEIAVRGNGVSIANGDSTPSLEDHTQFGLAAVASASITRTFTIHNTGAAPMTLGSVLISGAQAADFGISTAPATSVPAGGSTTLGITFDPTGSGVRTANVSFSTNDYDESSFDFFIAGTGNSAPLFVGQAFTTVQGKVTTIGEAKILPRAWDLDGQTVSITGVSATSAEGATVTRSGGTITYTPSPTFSGIDTFAITFTDGLTNVSGTVTMNVSADPGLNPANPPQISAQPGGVIRLAFSGIPGRVYGIQRSTNLVNWTQIATPAANTQGAITIDDPAPPSGGAFYRIIFPPQ